MKKETNDIETKIKKVIEKIRPSLQADGGDIKFIGWYPETGIVQVQLAGHCAHCHMSQITLKQGVEVEIKKVVPEVKEVINA